jgi:hypothetical protein
VVKSFGLQHISVCVCVLGVGCGNQKTTAEPSETPPPLSSESFGELPSKLSELGLYPNAPSLTSAPGAIDYAPGYPLWSDGGEKHRSIVLPEGERIDNTDVDNYGFPVGTALFKTFAFRTPNSRAQTVPVETRVLRLSDDGWTVAAYAWNEAGTDADLLDLRRGVTREVLSDADDVVEHSIPSRLECRQCHESSPSEVLGINELQLAKSGSLHDLAPRFSAPPRKPYAALPEHGPLTSAVLGYFVGNCVHCHNGTNGAASSFDLRPAVALQNIVDQPTASSATADGIRVTPGKPDESVLYLGVKAGTELEVKDMPPLGVALRDASAIDQLSAWITALAADDDP